MTVKQAKAEGLTFTGCWVRNYEREDARDSAKYIREKYKCRAVLVNEEGGIAVYADEKYENLKRLETLECHLKNIPAARQRLLEQLAALDEEESRLTEKIEEIQQMYGIEREENG